MNPGEFRRSQNWVGGTRPGNALYVPPPINELNGVLDAFEHFMHEEVSGLPPLIKAGLLHVQFETIHPFLGGNGRVGRLLITLYLCVRGVLHKPLLYLSLYLKTHRAEYYRLLQEVRERGEWEIWLAFFLEGVAETANQAFDAATRIVDLFRRDRDRIAEQGERVGSALRVHDFLQQNPLVTGNRLVQQTGLSAPTVNLALADLEALGIFESTKALPLTRDQLGLLIEAADSRWRDVEPAIFGTLLERALDPNERHALGAHYTPPRLCRATGHSYAGRTNPRQLAQCPGCHHPTGQCRQPGSSHRDSSSFPPSTLFNTGTRSSLRFGKLSLRRA